jgi:sensor histidine kinase YesM
MKIRTQLLASTVGAFLVLALSAAYILYATQQLQRIQDASMERERFIADIRDELASCRDPILDYLSTRSSNALARLLISSQNLRGKLPAYSRVTSDPIALNERELYNLIYAYLNLADQAVEEKRGRNIAGYTRLYDEMEDLLVYINNEIEEVSIESFRSRISAYQDFINESGAVQTWNLFFIISASLFSIALLFSSLRGITSPLESLAAMAAEISGGNFDVADIETHSVDEIDKAVDAFNQMKGEIKDFIEELRRQENIKAEYMQEKMRNLRMTGLVRHMEIYALQAQMNPHFLFNTINTGMQLAIVEGADRTSDYMENMAHLFRHIIRNKEIFVPLRHEIEGLTYYFKILEVRFPKNLDLVLDYDEALLDTCKVPVSILQPLVENCVVHAFRTENGDNSGKRNLINVRAEMRETAGGSRLSLSVHDNGCGIAPEETARLLNPLSLEESSIMRVMGLENVIQRLYFFYPDDPDIVKIETEKGEGTYIAITIDTGRAPCIEY